MAGVLTALYLSAALVTVYAFPGGAPVDACNTLTPNHGFSAQTTTSPFTMDMTPFADQSGSGQYWYTAGQTYTLRFADLDNENNTFRGFFIQSRLTADGTTRVGTFAVVNNATAQLRTCTSAGDAITHTNNADKTQMMMYWTAPPPGTGPLRFQYAVVQIKSTFWANQAGGMIQERPSSNPDILPVLLQATVIDYSGSCDDLDTAYNRTVIDGNVRMILRESVIYNNSSTSG